MNLVSYDFGKHVLNAIDVSIPQNNYFLKYGTDGIFNQEKLFRFLGIQNYFENRAIVANAFGTEILEIQDYTYSGYYDQFSRCNKFDAVITQIKELPLFTAFGDCPQLMVVGKRTISLLHASRQTLDNGIIKIFFKYFRRLENLADTIIGLSPYIFQQHFPHEYLDLKERPKWEKHSFIENGSYMINLFGLIKEELLHEGIKEQNILDLKLDTWSLSEKSIVRNGCAVSHRYAKKYNCKEGRGGMVLMLK